MKKAVKKTAAKKAASKDWRRETIARMRTLIQEAAPGATEEAKWKKGDNPAGVPTWSQDGIICTGETYKDKVKLTFARGASLADPAKLFNAADTGATRRAIDIREGDKLNEKAFKALVKEAVAANCAKNPAKKVAAKKTKRA
ncbi:MAG TPA: DUF1801 domain-containing protein [Candidatus Binatia bacterium]|nr:DUF1801 domain-containing protein [Candidatus Binatia bacterium]